jgi:hypothetical protein
MYTFAPQSSNPKKASKELWKKDTNLGTVHIFLGSGVGAHTIL